MEPQCRSSRGIQPVFSLPCLPGRGLSLERGLVVGVVLAVASRVHLLRSSRATTGSFAGRVDFLGRVNGGWFTFLRVSVDRPLRLGGKLAWGLSTDAWSSPPFNSRAVCSCRTQPSRAVWQYEHEDVISRGSGWLRYWVLVGGG